MAQQLSADSRFGPHSPAGEGWGGGSVVVPYTLRENNRRQVPYVFSSPHSGRVYLPSFLAQSRLDEQTIRKSEDFLVDQLFAGVVEIGAPLLTANFPRAYLDVNREPYELDPNMFAGKLPRQINARSVRVAGGLGTIARIVADSEEIYAGKLDPVEAIGRIETAYKPYHQALRNLLARTHVGFGYAILIDCHSMPSADGRPYDRDGGGEAAGRPDIVLGDRFGTSCASHVVHYARELLTDMGYRTVVNKPYAGGFITEHYGRPGEGLHALQIEINRGLYMDEARLKKTENFDALARDLRKFAKRIVAMPDADLGGRLPAAAE